MKVRSRLIVNYSVLSVILLIGFSMVILIFYTIYRKNDFEKRLKYRAESSVNMLLKENRIDSALLRLIDNNILSVMRDLRITISDADGHILYSNLDSVQSTHDVSRERNINRLFSFLSTGYQQVTFIQSYFGELYWVSASAIDEYGMNEFHRLLTIISLVFTSAIIVIIFIGFYSAYWSLKPFRKILEEIEQIHPNDLKRRLTSNGDDETAQMSNSFNSILDRIEQAFDVEKSFISNASHELRTPVTSIMGQVEVALNKPRSAEEYQRVLQSVYDDTVQMADIINGFLDLAETNLNDSVGLNEKIRLDDLLFSIVDYLKKKKPEYQVRVDFINYPENTLQLECNGNERLLRLLFLNLIDNACKYSDDKKAIVQIDSGTRELEISIIDYGIGISREDLPNIFKPLYRGSNIAGRQGHGLGLAIAKRIAEIHGMRINLTSELHAGTIIQVIINTEGTVT